MNETPSELGERRSGLGERRSGLGARPFEVGETPSEAPRPSQTGERLPQVADRRSEMEAVIEETRRIAMVGASARAHRPSHGVMAVLLDAGFEVVPVNPYVDEVLGVPAVPSLEDVEGPVDLVNVFRRVEHAPDIARAAIAIGARGLWLQLGLRSDEARRIATAGGLRYVEDECLGLVIDRTRHRHPEGPV